MAKNKRGERGERERGRKEREIEGERRRERLGRGEGSRGRKGEERYAPLLPTLLATEFFSVMRERHSQRKRESEEKEEEGRESQRRRERGERGRLSSSRLSRDGSNFRREETRGEIRKERK